MKHLSDDELVLHYYGEDDRYGSHLQACAECAMRHRALASTLETLAIDQPPQRGDQYGLEVWQRIRHRLPSPEPWWRGFWSWQRAGLATAALILIAVGFTAGRFWPAANDRGPGTSHVASTADAAVERRVLLLSVADHFERSERILTDVMNAPGGVDLSAEQQWAVDLVSASRLYRQDAIDANEMSVAGVLDELERTLLEIVHYPAQATPADLDQMRRRIDSAALLFKVRVMSTELRELTDPEEHPSSSSTRTIG